MLFAELDFKSILFDLLNGADVLAGLEFLLLLDRVFDLNLIFPFRSEEVLVLKFLLFPLLFLKSGDLFDLLLFVAEELGLLLFFRLSFCFAGLCQLELFTHEDFFLVSDSLQVLVDEVFLEVERDRRVLEFFALLVEPFLVDLLLEFGLQFLEFELFPGLLDPVFLSLPAMVLLVYLSHDFLFDLFLVVFFLLPLEFKFFVEFFNLHFHFSHLDFELLFLSLVLLFFELE